MANLLRRAAQAALDGAATSAGAALLGSTCRVAPAVVHKAAFRNYSPEAPAPESPPPKPTLESVKQAFTRSIAQVTRGDPNCAFSIMPSIVDIVLDCIPRAVHAVAVTSIDEEAYRAAATEQPFAANRKGALPLIDVVFSVDAAQIFPVIKFLHNHAQLQFHMLAEMTAIDYPERTSGRFEVTYVLYSVTANARVIVKTLVDELTPLDSLTPIYNNANWLERETWDMFGVFFKNHPDLRRLLTDYGFTHHPLRKDFPVQGYTEVFYSEARKAVTTRSIELAQSQRMVSGS